MSEPRGGIRASAPRLGTLRGPGNVSDVDAEQGGYAADDADHRGDAIKFDVVRTWVWPVVSRARWMYENSAHRVMV